MTEPEQPPEGDPGRPVDRRSPFMVGLLGSAGVVVTYALARLVVGARDVLTLIGIALFLAIGLDPVVRWLQRRAMPRWAAVAAVGVGFLAVGAGVLAALVPPTVAQAKKLMHELPTSAHAATGHASALGRLADHYHLQARLRGALSTGHGGSLLGGLLGAGRVAVSVSASVLTILVLTVYLLGDLPRIRRMIYRLVPASRRQRATVLGDQMFDRVGGFLLGNLLTSLIAGAGTLLWLLVFRVPYPLLLALAVALLDLIPVIGSTIGGIAVSLVALTVSLPVGIATLAFYIGYRLAEDYLLVPRIIGRTVQVSATATLIAVLLGGAVLGIVGALVAIPVAASVDILLRGIAYPRLDRS